MRRGRFAAGVADRRRCGQRAADLAQFLQRAVQQQRVARFLAARSGQGIAQFLQRVLLEREPGFQLG